MSTPLNGAMKMSCGVEGLRVWNWGEIKLKGKCSALWIKGRMVEEWRAVWG